MSSTLLRLGLWIVLLVVAAYVLHETFEDAPVAEYFSPSLLTKALALGILLALAGLVARVFERGAKVAAPNRCVVCKTPIPKGGIYCRAHLRNVLQREEDRTHMTRVRR
ncbi:MAG TPA: hypothetical protein VEZ11_04175 [Thermoanaerobaculia bacterium]|nr:hypothetical protein [Thermoanaerobaculia bacterium]